MFWIFSDEKSILLFVFQNIMLSDGFIFSVKINPFQMDLSLFLVVGRFLRKWTIHPSLPEIPVTMEPPPPHPPLPAGNSLYQLPRRQRGFRHYIIAFSLMVV
jgi:hypothetical protein